MYSSLSNMCNTKTNYLEFGKTHCEPLQCYNNLLDKSSYKGDREGGPRGESLQQELETFQLTKPVHQVNQPTLKPHTHTFLYTALGIINSSS